MKNTFFKLNTTKMTLLDENVFGKSPEAIVLVNKLNEKGDEKLNREVHNFVTRYFSIINALYQITNPSIRVHISLTVRREMNLTLYSVNTLFPSYIKEHIGRLLIYRWRELNKYSSKEAELSKIAQGNGPSLHRASKRRKNKGLTAEDFAKNIGKKVFKISNAAFKSGEKIATVESITEHPITKRPAYKLVEDGTVVECFMCFPVEV